MHKLKDVFGLDKSRNPDSFVVRKVEADFLAALDDRSINAIVIYGMSKQGKSSLMRHAVDAKKCIRTEGNRGLTMQDVFKDILIDAGFEYEETQVNGAFKLSWLWGEAGVGGKVTRKPLPIETGNPSSVAKYLAKYKPGFVVVIDQFHTLDDEEQANFATAVATFGTHGVKLVIIGTWSNDGYLARFNANLIGAVREFSLDAWSEKDLFAVLDKGLPLLRVRNLGQPARQSLVDRSEKNIALLQELTKKCLAEFEAARWHGVETIDNRFVLGISEVLQNQLFSAVQQSLVPIANIGSDNAWVSGKSRSWWILAAFLQGQQVEVMDGSEINTLVARTNDLAAAAAVRSGEPGKVLERPYVINLLKTQWYNAQRLNQGTPILAYHDGKSALVIVDAWTKCVLRSAASRRRLVREMD